MRKMQKPPAREAKTSKKEPLAEGLQIVVPTDSRGRRLWSKMTKEEIFNFARTQIEKRGIARREELRKVDCGLFDALRRRDILGELRFKEKTRSWRDISDEEIIELARETMKENGISERQELNKIDQGLYSILRRRGLLDEVGFEDKLRAWRNMRDEEVIDHTKEVMEKEGLNGKRELRDADPGLYTILWRRGLLGKIDFSDKTKKKRYWKGINDDELLELAGKLLEKREIVGRGELQRNDSGLYKILNERGLLDQVFARIEQQKTGSARDAVIGALEAFAANDNNSAEDEVA